MSGNTIKSTCTLILTLLYYNMCPISDRVRGNDGIVRGKKIETRRNVNTEGWS
jgi:hypothetical protein